MDFTCGMFSNFPEKLIAEIKVFLEEIYFGK
jgi:hypothetical protein